MEIVVGLTAIVVVLLIGLDALGTAIGFDLLGGKLLEGTTRQPEMVPMLQVETFIVAGLLDVVAMIGVGVALLFTLVNPFVGQIAGQSLESFDLSVWWAVNERGIGANINATLIGQSATFFILVLFCMKFVWPPIVMALQERQKKIVDDLDAANRAARGLELAHGKAGRQLREAKAQVTEIVEQTKKRASQTVDEAHDQARTGGERLEAQAQTEIERELNSVENALRAQAGALVVTGAEKILDVSIDVNAREQLVFRLVAEI